MQKQITWKAQEFVYYPKSSFWYIMLTVIAVLTLGYSLWTKEILMFITLLICFIVLIFFARRAPNTVEVTLSGKGLAIDNSTYTFSNLRTFWIIYEPPTIKTLNFETTNYINQTITIQLENQDPNEVKEFLTQYLPEDPEREEAYHEKLFRKLKY